jgi:hypothetical protein
LLGSRLDRESELIGPVIGGRGSETYKAELDAAITGGAVAFSVTIRQEVIHTATFPSSLRTTWPAASKQIGSMPPRFEGQSMTISR